MQRILVIQLRQLGDILLTTPSVREIKRAHPHAHVTFLCHSMGRLVLEENPFIDEIFYYDRGNLLDEWRLMQTLRERRFDIVFDFMNNPRSALYTALSGAPRRIAFTSRRQFAYTETVPRRKESDYIVREKFRLLQHIGLSPKEEALTLPWGEQHMRPFLELIGRDIAFRGARWRVVLCPTQRRAERRWPLECYGELAERLVARGDTAVIWIWGPGEEGVIDEAMALTKVATTKAPQTSFRELAALIANCDLYIGNTSGSSHVAISCGIPTLQLHGPTQAQAWSPMNEQHGGVEAPEGDIKQLGVDDVWDAVVAMTPVVEKIADARRQVGVRTKWTRT